MLKKILFSHVSPLIKQGQKNPLELKDLPQLPELWNPEEYLKGFDQLDGKEGGKKFITQILRILLPQAKRLGLLMIFILIFKMLSPLLIHELIESVGKASRGEINITLGIGVAVVLCLVQLISAIMGQHYVYHAVTSTQSAINGINQKICRSILKSKSSNNKGQVINRANADAELAGASLWAVGEVIQIFFTMLFTGSLLFHYLGTAAIAPLLIMALLMPLTRLFSRKFARVQGQIMHHRDERVNKMAQVLDGIKVIKSFVWEKAIRKQIGKVREEENTAWRKLANYKALSSASYMFASLLVALSAFVIYVAKGEVLTAATAFTCLTLFSYLEPCFRQLPKILGDMSSSFVAADRIASLLKESSEAELNEGSTIKDIAPEISLSDLTVKYEKDVILNSINLNILSGESIAVVGSVGSGKTTLLKTLLGDVTPSQGSFNFSHETRTAFVPQEPFLFHASLKENIIMNDPSIDDASLANALYVSCLDHDLEIMGAGLSTEISEGGGNLSGGQRQRVNLARAAFFNPNLILMDDPFSALDPNTEREIVNRLLFGEWNNKTRIVTTHRLEHLSKFNKIVFIEKGHVITQGTFDEVMLNESFAKFYFDHQLEEEKPTIKVSEASPRKTQSASENRKVIEEEEQSKGEVAFRLYWKYFKAMASFSKKKLPVTIGLLLLTSLSAMFLPILQNTWLSKWTQSLSSGSNNLNYLFIYAGIGFLSLAIGAFQHFYWARKAVVAAESLHQNALEGVLSTVLRYFDANPSGRILNRFSRDLDAVEKDLSWSLEEAFMAFLNSIGAVFVMLGALPFMTFVVLPVIFLYWFLQKAYRSCMRESKRLMAVARSPRISSIKEILDGASLIRCYQAESYFQKRFSSALKDYQKAFYGVVLINRWFSIRIPLVSSILSMTAAVGVIMMARSGNISDGIAGMALVYAFRFWDSLNWTVRAFGEAEAQMTSVERLDSLSTLSREVSSHEVESIPPKRSMLGEITFNNVFARYAPHLPDVLKGTTFTVPSGSKVGVIGRTGAGKSTLFSLLHRFIECKEGEILIDKRNINHVPLIELRQAIATIPQNPVLFSGTIRDNLDPLHVHSDEELLMILEKAHFGFLNNGLNSIVKDGGSNFSRGQKQLLCLARALVRRAQIIIVDEATASVDGKTDALIREILMNECPGITVLIIAHKLQSVSKCDMIIEMREGQVFNTSYLEEEAA